MAIAFLNRIEHFGISKARRRAGEQSAQLSILRRYASNYFSNGSWVQADQRVGEFVPQILGNSGQILRL
jgi:hypothetical protein